jgi:hypothetical protein
MQHLERKHIEELKKVKDTHIANMRNEMENDFKRAQDEHLVEIEKIKSSYEKIISEKSSQVLS